MTKRGPISGFWYVAFPSDDAVKTRAWWHRFCRPGRLHVFAALEWRTGEVLLVNYTGGDLQISASPTPLGDLIRDWQERLRCAILVWPRPGAPVAPRLRNSMTCVEVTKALLGIHAPLVMTPHGLEAYLIRHGAARLEAPP